MLQAPHIKPVKKSHVKNITIEQIKLNLYIKLLIRRSADLIRGDNLRVVHSRRQWAKQRKQPNKTKDVHYFSFARQGRSSRDKSQGA